MRMRAGIRHSAKTADNRLHTTPSAEAEEPVLQVTFGSFLDTILWLY